MSNMVDEHERKCRLHDQVQRLYDDARYRNDVKDAFEWALIGVRLASDLMRPASVDSWKIRTELCLRERKSKFFQDWNPKEWLDWPAA